MSEWHQDPRLEGRFHESAPDDLQVVVHDGEPRRTGCAPEVCWVRVTDVRAPLRMPVVSPDASPPIEASSFLETPVYAGRLLNQPSGLSSTNEGDTLLFVSTPGLPFPLRVDELYLSERPAWSITPCDACGADQCFDAPSLMAKTRFPSAPAGSLPVMFTAICPCGGTMVLGRVEEPHTPPLAKPWWKFW